MVLTGTFIGAGFASGQEILQYFGIYGKYGALGIVISCVLLGAFTYCTADNISYMGNAAYIQNVCKFRCVKWLVNFYMVLIFCTMITAFGECLQQVFNLPKIYGVILIDAVTIIILYWGAEGLIKLSVFVTPLIIAGIVFVFVADKIIPVFNNNYVMSSVIYTSYNVISLPFVMCGLKNMFKDRKSIMCMSVIFSGIIFALGLCILKLLGIADVGLPIPIMEAVSAKYTVCFVIVLSLSMLTTAVSNGYGFINAVAWSNNIILPAMGVFGILFSLFNFPFIVKYMYGIFGVMGIYILLINFYIFVKNREKPRKI